MKNLNTVVSLLLAYDLRVYPNAKEMAQSATC